MVVKSVLKSVKMKSSGCGILGFLVLLATAAGAAAPEHPGEDRLSRPVYMS